MTHLAQHKTMVLEFSKDFFLAIQPQPPPGNSRRTQELSPYECVNKKWTSIMVKLHLHHTVIPPWIYRIPSELRSQAGLGLPSTVVGDHTGIVSAVCFYFLVKDEFLSPP